MALASSSTPTWRAISLAIAVYLRARSTCALNRVLAPTDTKSGAHRSAWADPGAALFDAASACDPAALSAAGSKRRLCSATVVPVLCAQRSLTELFSLLVGIEAGANVAGHFLAILSQGLPRLRARLQHLL